jgi:hypothetical protein
MKTGRTHLAMLSLITVGLMAGSAMGLTADNYSEDFESYAVGSSITNVAGWTAADETSLIATTNYTADYKGGDYPIDYDHTVGTNTLQFAGGVTSTVDPGGASQTNWVDAVVKPVFSDATPELPPVGTIGAVHFNTNGNPMILHTPSNSTGYAEWVEIPDLNHRVTEGDWVRLTVKADMASILTPVQGTRFYQVMINGSVITNAAAFLSQNRASGGGGSWFGNRVAFFYSASVTNVTINGTGYLDDLVVTNALTVTPAPEKQATYIDLVTVSNVLMYGQTVVDAGLSGTATNAGGTNVVGAFAFDTPSEVPEVGTNSYAFTFTPSNQVTYLDAMDSVDVVTVASQPAIEAPSASQLTEGDTLGDVLLTGGTASNMYNGATAAGTFDFVLSAATVPTVGTNTYEVRFTPTDLVSYLLATGAVDVVVVAAAGAGDPPASWLSDTEVDPGDLDVDLRGDGMTPRQAWLASTDPTNTAFSFRVTEVRYENGTNTIEWVSVFVDTNLPPFGIWALTNLMDTTYNQVDTHPRTAGATPSTPVTNVWSEAAPAYSIYYRVAATNAP